MRRIKYLTALISYPLIMLMLSGCLGKVNRTITNYYVLDYHTNSERPELRRVNNTGKLLDVLDSSVTKTYDRNQIVVKQNLNRIQYLQNDVWANRLRYAIPNLVAQRLRAYNMFGQVTRGEVTDREPNFYLETNVLNIEKIEGTDPKAYLRMEYVLRDSTSQYILLTHSSERYADLINPSMVSLVQTFNEMILEETNVFAAKCNLYLSGRQVFDKQPSGKISSMESYFYSSIDMSKAQIADGELVVNTKTRTEEPIGYSIEELDSLNTVTNREEGEMNKPVQLRPGRYRVVLDDAGTLSHEVQIKPRFRTEIVPNWAELQVVILDQSKNRVRMSYDLWVKSEDTQGYAPYRGGLISMGDDEIGSYDKLWILPPAQYLVKLGGGSWSDLRNFVTVPLNVGEHKVLTMIVDPAGETNFLIGAGVFSDDDLGYGSKRIHKGAIHGNINLSSNNNVDKDKPSTSFTLSGQFDNSLDIHEQISPFHFTTRSLYDLGLNITNTSDFRFNLDDYSLKSVLLLYPFEKKRFLKNFAFYGRADQSTHFFDETTFFTENKNYVLLDRNGVQTDYRIDQPSLKSKGSFFPLRLKEGTGITYRINFGTSSWLSLRGGYGWQQDFNDNSYRYTYSGDRDFDGTLRRYDFYREDPDRTTKGLESTVILSAINLLNFFSINSTLDVLFPMGTPENTYRLENENRFNIRVYRNVSLDIKLNIQYDKEKKPWVVYDTSSFLRLSLFY